LIFDFFGQKFRIEKRQIFHPIFAKKHQNLPKRKVENRAFFCQKTVDFGKFSPFVKSNPPFVKSSLFFSTPIFTFETIKRKTCSLLTEKFEGKKRKVI